MGFTHLVNHAAGPSGQPEFTIISLMQRIPAIHPNYSLAMDPKVEIVQKQKAGAKARGAPRSL